MATATARKDNSALGLAVLVGAGALLLFSKGATAAVSPKAAFMPTSGAAGIAVTVSGSDWDPDDVISQVTVASVVAQHTLTVNTLGVLSGSITIPSLMTGAKAISITGSKSGTRVFTSAFTVTEAGAGWQLWSTQVLTVSVHPEEGQAGGGWISFGSSKTISVQQEPAAGGGWISFGSSRIITVQKQTEETYALTITIEPYGFGLIYKNPDKPRYEYGDLVILTKYEYLNTKFDHWTVNGMNIWNYPLELFMAEDINVVAHFVQR